MSGDRFLGVDGGGTKTRFVLVDAGGRIVAEACRGTTYHPQVGLDGVAAILADGIGEVVRAAGIGPDAIAYAFLGLPAHGEDGVATPRLDAIPEAILGHRRYRCGNDMVCGWAGSLACADGINIVAGTGSIGYGQRRGREARAGGWGEVFSDEGSAYWIAVQGLNAYARMSDGRLPRGPLHAALNAHFGLAADLELCAQVYGPNALTRDRIAQLSLQVAQAASAGDPVAAAIFARAGRELAGIVEAVRRALGFDDDAAPVPLACSGGAFAAGALLHAPFEAALQATGARFELRAPRYAPHHGAALYAMRLAGRALPQAPATA
ncbi:BadF/BadG/BcrA/BcrD ATPase family protein [Luteimonas sp. FCS-9]|uniref:N-acetylglucosamine kinase n=1 Tax=Luteimonas sp. FCS-9 TaxID=1547516 RepID=UPI00063E717B|nr:BadF/BadG/BcrA/BcrD ATPase family protein [Luteimonas sp. FCS-9]KLJ01941.1 N-acetylglucosamine kinase [Luteimonas sp. FCS-9]